MADQTEGFYRRPLPTSCIAFSSTEGRQLFREALELGGMEGYFALAEQFHTQAEPAFCGLGTMVVVLNALARSRTSTGCSSIQVSASLGAITPFMASF